MDKKYLIAGIVVAILAVVIYGATASATTVTNTTTGATTETHGSVLDVLFNWFKPKP